MSRFKINYGNGLPEYVDADQHLRKGDLINFYKGSEVVAVVNVKDMRSITTVDEDEGKSVVGFA
jgi:hypothetical protein